MCGGWRKTVTSGARVRGLFRYWSDTQDFVSFEEQGLTDSSLVLCPIFFLLNSPDLVSSFLVQFREIRDFLITWYPRPLQVYSRSTRSFTSSFNSCHRTVLRNSFTTFGKRLTRASHDLIFMFVVYVFDLIVKVWSVGTQNALGKSNQK